MQRWAVQPEGTAGAAAAAAPPPPAAAAAAAVAAAEHGGVPYTWRQVMVLKQFKPTVLG